MSSNISDLFHFQVSNETAIPATKQEFSTEKARDIQHKKEEMERSGKMFTFALIAVVVVWVLRKYAFKPYEDDNQQ